MKVLLPDYDYVLEGGSAEVKGGILYIYRPGEFKDVMYKLTYEIFGKKECCFCHRKFVELGLQTSEDCLLVTQTTLDHLIPQDFGGPTITNNMRPSCSQCNSNKGNYYPEEFEEFRQLADGKDKEARKARHNFRAKILETQEKRKFGEVESMPSEWFTDVLIRNIHVNFWLLEPLGSKYHKQEKFLKKYKRLLKPMILSRNMFLLDGFNTILLAKYNHITHIDAIILENVVYKGFIE